MGLRKLKNLNIDDVVECTSLAEYDRIKKLLHKEGFKWANGDSYLNKDTHWSPPSIGLHVYQNMCSTFSYKENKNYNIISSLDFCNVNNYELWD